MNPCQDNPLHVVITSGYRWSDFQWFLLGLSELENEGKINLSFQLSPGSKLLALSDNRLLRGIGNRIKRNFEQDSYNLIGYIILDNGTKKKFVIDSADSPFLFDMDSLSVSDCYFKMQYPVDLDNNECSFHLTKDIQIPWCDHKHSDTSLRLTQRGKRLEFQITPALKNKIHPLMVGPRQLAVKRFSSNYRFLYW